MNISQHCFVPRGEVLQGKYYSLGGTLSSNTTIASTERQLGDVYNCFQLFGSYTPTGTWYALRLFDRVDGSTPQGGNYVGVNNSNTGYVPPTMRKIVTYTSSAYTFSASTLSPYRYSNGYPVVCVMWYETPSIVLGQLSLGNSLTSDVIDEGVEIK